jgi:hypothetical protein
MGQMIKLAEAMPPATNKRRSHRVVAEHPSALNNARMTVLHPPLIALAGAHRADFP